MSDRILVLRRTSDAITSMRSRGQLPDAEYKKALVAIAHDLIELGEKEDAASLVSRLDDDYIDNVLPVQMAAEPVFRVVAVALGKLLRAAADPVDVELEHALLHAAKVVSKPC